ncbi:MAG: tRNA (N(6)-L-threonylcarbamoyladenosine(37)-C(2))-methylthiotransferase MtaB [Synergistaceae bacterium]|nr:tRNA (N(6)-L-threonylcarbamoyladenosine(37)-C(2))-methylthiotransferase MtaB [Synergistaceae bacterium]
MNKIKICVKILGCRSNLYEGDYLAGELKERGAEIVNEFKNADCAVIVSCAVTHEADRKCRQLIRRARREIGADGVLAVCGCWAQAVSAEDALSLGIDILTGSRSKNILPKVIYAQLENNNKEFIDLRDNNKLSWQWEELGLNNRPLMHTRAFIKIQDGCDHFCSYCIIPFLRGRPVSRPIANIIEEVNKVVSQGCREIVLTGIHLGMYGRDLNINLSEVIKNLSRIKGLERLRLGSLEPFSLDENLLNALANSKIFCRHLHLPMQSGDDEILNLMRRGYSASEFKDICVKAKKYLGDDLHISSDILVGFPGESDNAFNNTLKLMRDAGLGRVHVFPFSLRKGTLADKLYKDRELDNNIKSQRVARAIELGDELLNKFAERFIGRELDVLIEQIDKDKNLMSGHTENFLEAEIKDIINEDMRNKIIKAKIIAVSNGKLEGVYDGN